MPKDFSGQNLRGRSFKGQDLTGANFSHADIRGANFTNAILKSANFSHAKAGLQRRWIIVLVIVSLLLSALSGFISGIAGVFVEALCSSISQDSIIPGEVVLIVLAVFLLIISIRYGLGIVSGTVAGVVLSTVSATVLTGVAKVTMPLVATITVAGVGVGVGVGAVAVSGVVAVAGVRVGAVAVAVSLILAAAWAAIGAWGIGVVQKAAARLVGSTVGAATGAISMLGAMAAAAVVVLLGGYIGWCALTGDEKYPFVRTLAIAFAATGGSSFRKADLTDANFSQATLKSTDFRGAILIRTRWFNTKKLDRARVANSILAKASIRDLLVSGDGYKKSYVGANLKGANLTGANLEKANFKEADISQATLQEANLKEANLTKTQAVGTDFTNAYLTGACLEAWNIDSTTKLDQVDCQYVYLLEHEQPGSSQRGERRPSSGDFASGEFTKLFEEVLNTVDLIFRDGIDWKAFVAAFKKVQVENEGTELAIQSIENKGDGVVVVRVSVPDEANKEKIHSDFTQNYELALKAIEEKYKAELKAKDREIAIYHKQSSDMQKITELLASRPINVNNQAKATAEGTAVNQSNDQSRIFTVGNIQGDFKPIGSALNSDNVTISGTVAETINQLPDSSEVDKPEIKELLAQLQEAIEADTNLSQEDKVEALEQVKALAEAGKNPQEGAMQKAAKTAMKILKGTVAGLPTAATLYEACNKLLPAIASLLGLA